MISRKSNNILLIGGGGFIGKYLHDRLVELNFNVTIIDKKDVNFTSDKSYKVNINKFNELEQIDEEFDLVIHLAAVHQDNIKPVSRYYETNVNGTENVIKFCEQRRIGKLLFISSQAIFGSAELIKSEDSEPLPDNDYGKSKLMAEKKLLNWNKYSESNLVIIRPSVVFGCGSTGNFDRLIKQIRLKKFFMIGSGNNTKSVSFVKNLVAYIIFSISLIDKEKLIISNYADKPDMKIKDLVDYIYLAFGYKKKKIKIPYFIGIVVGYFFDFFTAITGIQTSISSLRIKKFCANSIFNSTLIDKFNYKPPYNFVEAISDTVKKY